MTIHYGEGHKLLLHHTLQNKFLVTQLQQREERENIPPEEENHDMLDAQGHDSRTTGKNVCVLEFLAAFYLTLLYFFHMHVLYF